MARRSVVAQLRSMADTALSNIDRDDVADHANAARRRMERLRFADGAAYADFVVSRAIQRGAAEDTLAPGEQ